MKKVTMDVLKDAARRLLFDMSEEEYQTLYEEFDILSKLMEKMGEVEGIDSCEPMTFPFSVETDYLREDSPVEPLKVADVLKNAGDTKDQQIRVPRVVQ